MKLKFLFLFLFIAKFCVAQNQLQFFKVHYSGKPISKMTFDTTAKTYILNENQEVRLEYYDVNSNQFYEEFGALKNITDSTIEIKNEVIRISSITEIAFDKSINSKYRRRMGRKLLIPQTIFFAGLGIGAIGYNTKLNDSHGESIGIAGAILVFSFIGSVFYLPIDIIALSTMSFTRRHLKFIAKENKNAWVIHAIHKTK